MATTQPPSSTRLDPRIRYYIHRKHGNAIVPLIPADQLPFHLKDFPQNMNHRQLSDGGWKFLEETPEIPFPLALLSPCVQGPSLPKAGKAMAKQVLEMKGVQAYGQEDLEETTMVTQGKGDVMESAAKQTVVSSHQTTPSRFPTSTPGLKSLTDSMAAIYTKDARRLGYTAPKPSPTPRLSRTPSASQPKDQEYCRHWLKTGTCVHTLRPGGCWYRHEMASPAELRELGMTGIPRWHQEQEKKKEGVKKVPILKLVSRGKKIGDIGKKEAMAEVYGVYTTNTVDEPMLIDIGMDEKEDGSVEDEVGMGVRLPNPEDSPLLLAATCAPSSSASSPVDMTSDIDTNINTPPTSPCSERVKQAIHTRTETVLSSGTPTPSPSSQPPTLQTQSEAKKPALPPTSPTSPTLPAQDHIVNPLPPTPTPTQGTSPPMNPAPASCPASKTIRALSPPQAQPPQPPKPKTRNVLNQSIAPSPKPHASKAKPTPSPDDAAAKLAKVFSGKRKVVSRKGYKGVSTRKETVPKVNAGPRTSEKRNKVEHTVVAV